MADDLGKRKSWWLDGNFAPVADEVDAFDLKVEGALPPELTGVYMRNGPNPKSAPSGHWFMGDGMLHGMRLERGKAPGIATAMSGRLIFRAAARVSIRRR